MITSLQHFSFLIGDGNITLSEFFTATGKGKSPSFNSIQIALMKVLFCEYYTRLIPTFCFVRAYLYIFLLFSLQFEITENGGSNRNCLTLKRKEKKITVTVQHVSTS